MKSLLLAMALGVLAIPAVPAAAQDLRFRVGPDGIVLRNDDPRIERRRFEDRRVIDRRVYREGVREGRFGDESCRIVETRRERRDGTIVVRRERRCI
jgi:hypothetical protein